VLNDRERAEFDADWASMDAGLSAGEARAQRKRQHLEDELRRLAGLSKLDYTLERKGSAKSMGLRLQDLDELIAKHRPSGGSAGVQGPPQWSPPENVWKTPIDGTALLAELTAAIRRFVLLDETAALIAALWVLFTWVFEQVAETNPFLRVISPTPQCGKSTLFKVLQRLARRGWLVSRITPSAFTRSLQREHRTLFLDEGDAFLHENEVMRNVLDGASDPDTANITMSVKSGDEWMPTEFNVFVPIAIASIGTLRKMQTVEDRSIAIHLKRATPAELKQLAKGRKRELESMLAPLAEKCARWAADNAQELKGRRPEMPNALSGREQDKWEPLVAIADSIGVEASNAARLAAITTSHARDGEDAPLGIGLLGDIKQLFEDRSADKLPSKGICDDLAKLEGRPWAEYGRAQKPISPNQLARLLRLFQIFPHTIRLADDSTPKGYERDDFKDAFDRYPPDSKNTDTPISGESNRHNATNVGRVWENDDFESATTAVCGGSKNDGLTNGEKNCGGVADQNSRMGSDRHNSGDRVRFKL
jgi:hypothetical protein